MIIKIELPQFQWKIEKKTMATIDDIQLTSKNASACYAVDESLNKMDKDLSSKVVEVCISNTKSITFWKFDEIIYCNFSDYVLKTFARYR